MTLGEKIKLLRTEQQLTQPELAAKAGIEQSYLSKLENEKGSPSFDIINRVAKALGHSGMELIDTLSQSYVESQLSHIPEIAAEYAAVRQQQNQRQKRRFTLAALVCVLGVGIFFLGSQSVLFSEYTYIYQSEGVIKPDEHNLQFNPKPIQEIGETKEAAYARVKANLKRTDLHVIHTTESKGWSYVVPVEGGKRHYEQKIRNETNAANDLTATLGMMLIVASAFMFWYAFWFKRT